MFKLQIDDRERINLELFNKTGKELVKVEVKRLGKGDYAIWYGEILLCVIERKTWDDLAASLKDGRLEEQIAELIGLAKHNVRVVLLIEGRKQREHNRISLENLESKLDSILLRHGMPIIFTLSEEETATRLFTLIDHYPSETILKQAEIAGGTVPTLDKATRTPEFMAIGSLAQMKGVSAQTAQIILEKFSIRQLLAMEAKTQDLENLKYPTGILLGKARADKIIRQIRTHPWLLVSDVTGVTLDTAKKIVQIPQPFSIQKIADIEKGTRRLGDKVAERVINVMNFKSSRGAPLARE